MKFNYDVLIIICLITTVIILEVHQEIKGIEFPYYFYISVYYLRAIMSLFCVYSGVIKIKRKIKNGFYYLIIGLLFSILSIAPSVMSLYMFNSIDLSLLPVDEQKIYNSHINSQKHFLLISGFVISILASVFYFRRKRIT